MASVLSAVTIDRHSDFANALRGAKVALDVAAATKPIRCIGVTSTEAGGGATTVAAGLAALYAASGARVVLIDGNLEDPRLTEALGAPADKPFGQGGPGLEGLLRTPLEPADIDSALVAVPEVGFRLLPVGASATLAGSDLLGSERMRQLLEILRRSEHMTIIDLPFLGLSPDARAAAGAVDAMIVVVVCGETTAQAVANAADDLEAANAAHVAVVINQMERS